MRMVQCRRETHCGKGGGRGGRERRENGSGTGRQTREDIVEGGGGKRG